MDEAQRKKVEQDVIDLIQKLSALCEATGDHSVALSALLATFMSVSVAHPCCTSNSVQAALDVGAKLLARSFYAAPSGSSLH